MARAQAINPFALDTTIGFGLAPAWASAAAGSAPLATEESNHSLRRIIRRPFLRSPDQESPLRNCRISISSSYAIQSNLFYVALITPSSRSRRSREHDSRSVNGNLRSASQIDRALRITHPGIYDPLTKAFLFLREEILPVREK